MPGAVAQRRRGVGSVGKSLEDLARSLSSRRLTYSATPEAFVEAQLALALEHIDRQRELRAALMKQILGAECRLDTLLLPLPGGYLQHDSRVKYLVRDRLLGLEQERRRIAGEHDRRVAELETQLLQLVIQRLVLGENGGSER